MKDTTWVITIHQAVDFWHSLNDETVLKQSLKYAFKINKDWIFQLLKPVLD